MSIRHLYASLFLIGLTAASPALTSADEQIHLLGFVEQLCPDKPYCFELRVEPGYIANVGERISVRYEAATTIFDAENYELTLAQSNIIPGSHLRLLLASEPAGSKPAYRAVFIWIGD